ncbi:TetR family transcriptional regulator [Phycicoccus sp. CSK15P-2]|nr:TetR family transcriptional regulator [Phycicoccus sp. CSK15P-2]
MLRERGADGLALREIAGHIGVTHAAPRRYFPDRQALLDALAVDGLARLGARLRTAADASSEHHVRVRALAAAYIDLADTDATSSRSCSRTTTGPSTRPSRRAPSRRSRPFSRSSAARTTRAARRNGQR